MPVQLEQRTVAEEIPTVVDRDPHVLPGNRAVPMDHVADLFASDVLPCLFGMDHFSAFRTWVFRKTFGADHISPTHSRHPHESNAVWVGFLMS